MKINSLHDLNGERKSQLLILTDKDGKRYGLAAREECHKGKGKTHLAFMAFVTTPDKKIVLTQRSKQKSLWPLFWDAAVVSHVLPKETVEAAAKRRGKQELGIEVDFKIIGAFFYSVRYKRNSENEYCYVLVGKISEAIHSNPVEIEKIRFASIEKIEKEKLLTPTHFTPWLNLALEKFNLSNYL